MTDNKESAYNFTPPSREKKDDEDEKDERAKKIGAVAGRSSEKSTDAEAQQKRRPSLDMLFKRGTGRDAERESVPEDESQKDGESDQEVEPARKTPLDELKRIALRTQLATEIPEALEQVANTAEGSRERLEAETILAQKEGVLAKAEDPSLEVADAVESEYQQRLAELSDDEIAEAEEQPPTGMPDDELASFFVRASEEDQDTAASAPSIQPSASSAAASQPPSTPPPQSPTPRSSGSFGGGYTPPAERPATVPKKPESTAEQSDVQKKSSNRAGGAFLLGALIGNRFGKNRAEKKAEVQHKKETSKLEDELAKTRQHLEQRENDLKFAVTEKYKAAATTRSTGESATTETSSVEAQPDTVAALKPAGQVLRQVVETVGDTNQKQERSNRPQPTREQIKAVEQKTTPQLLEEAETLFIGGNSVRSLYESNQIDRKGLVEIVQTALRGGNIKAIFERVELGRERQLERAREFRHDPALGAATSSDNTTTDDVTQNKKPATTLPNTPDASLLAPLKPWSSSSNEDSQPTNNTVPQLEPVDLTKLRQSSTPIPAVAAVIAIGVVVLLILFLFSL